MLARTPHAGCIGGARPTLVVPLIIQRGDNAYTKATKTPSKVKIRDHELEKTLTVALRSYVSGKVKKAFDRKLQKMLVAYLLQSGDPNFDFSDSPTKTDKMVSVLDIVQREIDRFYDDFRKESRVIVRLDGSAGRMTAMAELLWRLIGRPVPYQICNDIKKETVELHRKNPLVDEAVHIDVYKYLESNQFEEALSHLGITPQTDSKKISIYLDFCFLPEGKKNKRKDEKTFPGRYDYNIGRIRRVMQKYPEATLMISYPMRIGRARENKSPDIWKAKLYKSGIELQKVKTCKENKFRTEYLTLRNRPALQSRPHLFASKRKNTSLRSVCNFESPNTSGLTVGRPKKKPRTPTIIDVTIQHEVIDLT